MYTQQTMTIQWGNVTSDVFIDANCFWTLLLPQSTIESETCMWHIRYVSDTNIGIRKHWWKLRKHLRKYAWKHLGKFGKHYCKFKKDLCKFRNYLCKYAWKHLRKYVWKQLDAVKCRHCRCTIISLTRKLKGCTNHDVHGSCGNETFLTETKTLIFSKHFPYFHIPFLSHINIHKIYCMAGQACSEIHKARCIVPSTFD